MWCHVIWCEMMQWAGALCGLVCDVIRCGCVMSWIGTWCAVHYGDPITGKPLRGPGQSGVKSWDAKHKKKARAHVPVPRLCTTEYYSLRECNYDIHVWKSQTMRRPVHCAEQCVGYRTWTTFMFLSDNTWIVQSHNHSHNYHHHCSWGACRAPQVQITQRISIVPLYTGPGTIRSNGLILPNHSAAKWLCSSSLRVRAWSRLINWPVGST